MSIYATLWALQFPRFGEFHIDCEWLTVIAQGVPAHVGAEAPDPYTSFLPTLPNSVADDLRAVVFAVEGTVKGTIRSAQEYSATLLVLSGAEYASVPFSDLHTRLCDALRDDRPRLLAEVVQNDGSSKLIFENQSVGDAIAPRRFHD
ncbi:MAG: hypothetical protein ACLQO1_25120 [Steroidobacteraceae bacterium]